MGADSRGREGAARWIVLAAGRTKANQSRTIPIGQRLRAELEMRRSGPDGKAPALDKFVFGNEVGEQVGSIKRAWRTACRRAGIVDLHFHDLRREFGSRLLESGAADHDVQKFLGHANITTTSRYLSSTPLRLERAMAALEAGFAHGLHTATKTTENERESEAVEVEGKSAEESGLATGDPGGDRTRDPLIKSQMLYH